ncbi:MAG: hypothetical protein WCJ94_01685 [bacterium]
MKMEHHIAVSVPVAVGVWFTTHNWYYVAMSLFLGFLVDVDHVIDYIREEGTFNMKGLFKKSYLGDFHHFYVIFHAYEYILIAWIVGFFTHNYTFSIVFTVAYLSHMLPDQLMNNTKTFGYFMTYRIYKKFVMTEFFYNKGQKLKKIKTKTSREKK